MPETAQHLVVPAFNACDFATGELRKLFDEAAEEKHIRQFRESLEAQNFQLAPLKKGWGPYQGLEQAARQRGLNFTTQQLKEEAIRIRDREFAHNSSRRSFKIGEVFSFLSQRELDCAVNIERIRFRSEMAH